MPKTSTTTRVKLRKTVAKQLGVTERAVGNWKHEAWWQPEFQTRDGYDIDAIRAAREANSRIADGDAIEQRRRVKLEQEKAKLEQQLLDLRRKQREEERELGNSLPADVYGEFVRELLGLLRSELEGLPVQLSREVSKAALPYVYVPPEKQKSLNDRSPLQKRIGKLITRLEEWLAADPEEETL